MIKIILDISIAFATFAVLAILAYIVIFFKELGDDIKKIKKRQKVIFDDYDRHYDAIANLQDIYGEVYNLKQGYMGDPKVYDDWKDCKDDVLNIIMNKIKELGEDDNA